MSGAQFDALPYEEGRRWELVDGELIAVSSTTLLHQLIMQRILYSLIAYFSSNPGEGLVASDVEFALGEDFRVRPDVLVLLGEHAESVDPERVPIPGAPDIAVEVISPSERAFESQQKVAAYLRFGTREVWQIYPKSKSAVIHHGATSITLHGGEQITTKLLPGFSLEVHSLFRS